MISRTIRIFWLFSSCPRAPSLILCGRTSSFPERIRPFVSVRYSSTTVTTKRTHASWTTSTLSVTIAARASPGPVVKGAATDASKPCVLR